MKVAVIGCAHMQAKQYTEIFLRRNIPVLGVFDRNVIRGNQFAKEFNLPFYPDLEKILNLEIDTVLICSENALHYDYALVSAFHKKNLIIEKPIALTPEDAKRMILTCRQNGVKLLVAHPIRFSQTIIDLKKTYDQGKLGTILAINGTNHGKNPGDWFLNHELAGGGAIIDHMVHLIDLSKWIFNFELSSIFTLKHATKMNDIEDVGLIHMHFTNGVFMSLDTSWNHPINYPTWGDITLEIITDKGQLIVDGIGRRAELYAEPQHHSYQYFEKNMDDRMMEAFIDCIKNDLPEPVSGEDGLYTIKVARLAYESAYQQRVIKHEEFSQL